MGQREPVAHRKVGTGIVRAIGHGIWMLIPVISLSFLSWVPAAQAYWRARTAGWLLTTLLLTLASAVIITGMATDADGAGFGALIIGAGIGGVVAAAAGRKVVFGPRQPRVQPATTDGTDPAVREVLERREWRRQAREIVASDPAMAVELRIGRPDLPSSYADGGLVDLNNVTPEGIVEVLGWDPAAAKAFVADREARHGYTSLTEIVALSGVDPDVLDQDAERIVVLPYRRRT